MDSDTHHPGRLIGDAGKEEGTVGNTAPYDPPPPLLLLLSVRMPKGEQRRDRQSSDGGVNTSLFDGRSYTRWDAWKGEKPACLVRLRSVASSVQ